MATDATGTPTTTLGIPKFNTAADIPSGKGFNAAMDYIDDLIEARGTNVPGATGVKIWNNATKSWETPAGGDGTKFLRDDGTFAATTADVVRIFQHVGDGTGGQIKDTNVILGGNIPNTYRHLKLVIQFIHDSSAALGLYMRFNNDSSLVYNDTYIDMNASAAPSGTERLNQSEGYIGGEFAAPAGWPAGSSSSVEVLIPNYNNADRGQDWHFRGIRNNAGGGAGAIVVRQGAGAWRNNAAVTRIQLFPNGPANWTSASVISLYGMK